MLKGLVYLVKNNINSKIYIGKTLKTLKKRVKGHKDSINSKKNRNSKFINALRKYGIENFEWKVLKDNILEEDLNWCETCFIVTFDSKTNGYNSTLGGLEEFNLKPCNGRIPWNKGLSIGDSRIRKIVEKCKETRKQNNYISSPRNKNLTYEILYGCVIDKQMTRRQAAEFIGTTERLVKKWKQIWNIKSLDNGRFKTGRKFTGNQYVKF